MPQRESAIVGKNNVRALVTGQEELLVKVNSFGPGVTGFNITGPLGQQSSLDSVSTVLSTEQASVLINTAAKRYTASDDNASSFGNNILSISFASVGTADARISFNGGGIYIVLKPGETLNLDAGGIMNFYDGALIAWDTTTNAGSSLLIAANYI